MVAAAHGLTADLQDLRTRLGVAPRGATLQAIVGLAADLGFAPRAVRIGLHRLGDLRLPAMIHWRLDHYVVLERFEAGRLHIVDPASGRRVVPMDEAATAFSGVAIELTRTSGFSPGRLSVPRHFRAGWLQEPRFRALAVQAIVLTFLVQIALVALPFGYRHLLDNPGRFTPGPLAALALGGALFAGVQGVSTWLRARQLAQAGGLLVHRVSTDVFKRMLALPVGFFQRRTLGELTGRVRSAEALRRLLLDQALTLVVDLPVLVLLGAAMVAFDPRLSLVVAVCVGVELAVRARLLPRLRGHQQTLLAAESQEQGALLESLRAIQTIKISGAETQRLAKWRNESIRALNEGVRLGSLQGAVAGLSAGLATFELLCVVGLALAVLPAGQALGTLVGFLTLRGLVRERLASAIQQVWSLQSARLHLDRLDDIMLAPIEARDGAPPSADADAEVRLEGVAFGYSRHEAEVLADVDLLIRPGRCVAIVGASGSGKSTLIKLLLRLEEPTRGRILYGATDVRSLDARAWRGLFGVVMQDDLLLAGSIADNIAFFDAEVDMDRVRAAAAQAAIHDEICAMPMEYATVVGDVGAQLSGGQRQRILIARALYRAPRFVLLDEGTANLDAAAERRIAEVLASLSMTRIVIAHRSHLTEVADEVYEMAEGRLRRVR